MAFDASWEIGWMCGIAGFSGGFDGALLERMSATIAHRGPDDEGLWLAEGEGIGLAHRRLAIIDLSPLGHQPMVDATGQHVIVFNGEIYNYRELRRDLERDGFGFRSHSDTEVLLNLYRREGTAMLSRLNGIFAFALWDAAERCLFLARDGVGVKPLYHATTPRGFLFASEMKAILQAPDVGRDLDPGAIQHHLAYLWAPAPETMLREVRKLPPGHAMIVRDGRVAREWSFYDLPYDQPLDAVDEEEAAHAVREAIRTAVERQMVADVEVGAFLSGGLDSSSVVAFARRALPDRRMRCFSIGFRDRAFQEEGFADDLGYARKVAQHLDVDLDVVEVGSEMADRLETMIWHLDEPQADPAPIHVLYICELARRAGIKVLLSGAGGDDIFTGYRRHLALQRERVWAWLPRPVRKAIGRAAAVVPPSTPAGRRLRKGLLYAGYDGDERLASYFYWTRPEVMAGLYGPWLREQAGGLSPSRALIESLSRLPPGTHPLNRMLYLEGKHFLADHNLNYGDKMSMAVGVEVRVPLLDPDLVALAARLPIDLKQRGSVGKWIFKKAMEPLLPAEVIYRPKTGFGAPIRRWIRHDLRALVDDVLSEASLKERGLFDAMKVRDLVERDRQGREDGSFTLFTALCIELWCRRFLRVPVSRPAV